MLDRSNQNKTAAATTAAARQTSATTAVPGTPAPAVKSTAAAKPATTPSIAAATGPSPSLAPSGLDIHQVLAKVGPSVVSIEISQQGRSGSLRPVAAGSGVVISADGMVLTNAHVVSLTDQNGRTLTNAVIQVRLSDGSLRSAKVLGSAPSEDVALVKVDDTAGLTVASLGDSDALQVGDDVVAIGNALDLGASPTVTRGIISAKNRSLDVDANLTLEGLLQTDAAINHGNSGGALVNAAGELVGIPSAGLPDAQNVGFAIAINTVKPLIDQLKNGNGGATTTPVAVLGVTTQDSVSGVTVAGISSGSGAERAGIQVGDVITSVDSKPVTSSDELGAAIRTHKPGDTLTVAVDRGGKTVNVTATLGARAS